MCNHCVKMASKQPFNFRKGNLAGFPSLEINPSDVNGSWKRFMTQFRLQVKYMTMISGTTKVKNETTGQDEDINVFDDGLKCIALLTAIGSEGQSVLLSKGFRIDKDDFVLNYADAIQALESHYGREESLNVRIHKMINARQDVGEDNRDFLRRLESMGRNLEIFYNETSVDKVREKFTEVMAVNGLRDLKLRKELLAMPNLNWATLNVILSSRGTAEDAESKLENAQASASKPVVTQHVAHTGFQGPNYPQGRRSRIDSRDDYRDSNRNRFHSRDRDSYRHQSRDRDSYRHQSRDRDSYRHQSRDRDSNRNRFNSRDRDSSRNRFYRDQPKYHDHSSSRHDYRNSSRDRYHNRDNFSHRSRRDSHSFDSYHGRNDRFTPNPRSPSLYRNNRPVSSDRDDVFTNNKPASHEKSEQKRLECFKCGGNHLYRNCEFVKCYICHQTGHISDDCGKRNRRNSGEHVKFQSCNRVEAYNGDNHSYRIRDPSPYPDRGRRASPEQFLRLSNRRNDDLISFQDT